LIDTRLSWSAVSVLDRAAVTETYDLTRARTA
jgi:hypothetical protein